MTSEDKSPELPAEVLQAITAQRPADGLRRCFICLMDEEPSDLPGTWVDPCPCTLEAHQDCMLAWVTDCERTNKPLKCPVCKSTIEIEGSWDVFVALNDAVHKRFTRSSPFVLLTGVSMGVQFSLQMYGALALWSFAGKNTMMRFLLGPGMVIDANNAGGLGFVKERVWSALVMMNVAPTLLFARLLPGLSNKIFLPSASLYGMYHIMRDDSFLTWPPSPRLAMAIFPFVRSVYYNLWREFVLPYEVGLNRQILGLPPVERDNNGQDAGQRRQQERNGEGGLIGLLQGLIEALGPDDEDDDGQGGLNAVERIEIVHGELDEVDQEQDGEVMIELRIEEVDEAQDVVAERDHEPVEVNHDDAAEPRHEGNNEAPNEQVEVVEADQEAGGPDAAQPNVEAHPNGDGDQPQHEAPQAPPARRMGLGAVLSSMSDAIVGALILPGVSFAMGEALRLLFPKAWTSSTPRNPWMMHTSMGGRPGLLQQQWGRSLVGGCLFVVLKDVIRVYTKSRKVASMGKRRVKNVDRQRRN